ncbi:bifunctional hydroxymethylpyrimidine kinase/phosphomethylpyrimidine kinase [Alkalihalobacillus sp. AL-G]|uniref:bifunctional hydroxymethylpyrimidine kinase/phosphomethylpyrimidine kinase n=1 Tax=Alkalihalobacillus sp. AL-G TaxID=2926399 RepID=UPI0027298F93|nr:bifunctional hydroxymethylpyrimidine kinase/phosphomethylpyrimidine kinase [Alkalihalobacillus sp. AL-G]WLD93898.1 bifunctional hydroxymethylpyrimidine kinase/phosphomethylpyrimidine kinase [Alkalihalobacillus sp. AL-G]
MTYKALTIAGSDSGGGAGIQADLKTFQELDVYGMSVITALTAQNTLGVQGVHPVPVEFVSEQLQSIADDLEPDALKTGMLFSAEIIETVANHVKKHKWTRLIVDPVMIAKGGASLLQQEAVKALQEKLLPSAYVVTPNIPEAEVLTGVVIQSEEDRKKAAIKLYQMGAEHVVIKGGHNEDKAVSVDLHYDGSQFHTFKGRRFETKHTHGTGCTFAAVITAEVAKGHSVQAAIGTAKEFITAAIENELGIGSGHGPTNHWAYRKAGVRT